MAKKKSSANDMLFIPAGDFEMGISREQAEKLARDFFHSDAEVSPAIFYSETPQHKVKIHAFSISKTEVTNREFKEFVDAGGYANQDYWIELIKISDLNVDEVGWQRVSLFKDSTGAPGPLNWKKGTFPEGEAEHPVEGVSWFEATAYCRWRKLRLPSEEEWEYAARGSDNRMFPWGDKMDVIQKWGDKQAAKSSPAGSIAADKSPFGVMDMARNVSEWVDDAWATYPDSLLGQVDEVDEAYGIVRGGNYNSIAYQMRTTARERRPRLTRANGLGFRCAK